MVQSIKRKPEDKQFDLELLKAVKGTPWQPNPGQNSGADAGRLPEPIAIEPVVVPSELPPPPAPADRAPSYRRMYIRHLTSSGLVTLEVARLVRPFAKEGNAMASTTTRLAEIGFRRR